MALSRGIVGCVERFCGSFLALCDSDAVMRQTSLTGQPLVRVIPLELARSCDLLSAVKLILNKVAFNALGDVTTIVITDDIGNKEEWEETECHEILISCQGSEGGFLPLLLTYYSNLF